MFRGVCPKVGVVKINADLHAIFRRTFSERDSRGEIVVSAAVPVAVLIIRIVPDADTGIVDAGLCHGGKYILLGTVGVVIFHAAFFFRENRGDIHAADKTVSEFRDRLHVDACGFCGGRQRICGRWLGVSGTLRRHCLGNLRLGNRLWGLYVCRDGGGWSFRSGLPCICAAACQGQCGQRYCK